MIDGGAQVHQNAVILKRVIIPTAAASGKGTAELLAASTIAHHWHFGLHSKRVDVVGSGA